MIRVTFATSLSGATPVYLLTNAEPAVINMCTAYRQLKFQTFDNILPQPKLRHNRTRAYRKDIMPTVYTQSTGSSSGMARCLSQ